MCFEEQTGFEIDLRLKGPLSADLTSAGLSTLRRDACIARDVGDQVVDLDRSAITRLVPSLDLRGAIGKKRYQGRLDHRYTQ